MNRIRYLWQLHDEFNEEDFGNELCHITILIKKNRHKDGWYLYRAHRDWTPIVTELHRASITISEGCWPEGTVEGTLLHEMIHQYQCEVLGVAPHHNDLFNKMAEELEIKYGFDIK